MTNSMIYRKPEEVRYTLGELLGEGEPYKAPSIPLLIPS